MERQIRFRPAFDKRHSDPNKNYGIHGVDLAFYLKGERGAVQFVLYTNWQLPHVQKEMDERILNKPAVDEIDLHVTYHPLPADLGYHSPKPMYEGQEALRDECELLGGRPCYYDGSGLNAEKVFDVLREGGDEAVWKYLEDYYTETFGELV